ncbi:hypothetical protein DdX_20660 [Ditylenchus destructor]|uniref:Uncharacterized protein n=1 Tax=Ditylenchus destructor TaxID=166010 RepID=A0AAD4MHP3_9BILA|nr:hypothetical protein DdX_20660 [Ditylenchus destructor]
MCWGKDPGILMSKFSGALSPWYTSNGLDRAGVLIATLSMYSPDTFYEAPPVVGPSGELATTQPVNVWERTTWPHIVSNVLRNPPIRGAEARKCSTSMNPEKHPETLHWSTL